MAVKKKLASVIDRLFKKKYGKTKSFGDLLKESKQPVEKQVPVKPAQKPTPFVPWKKTVYYAKAKGRKNYYG